MNVYKSIDDIPYAKESCITIGSFDGIHLGHKKIIDKVVSLAKKSGSRSVVVTFDPIPKRLIRGKNGPLLLTTIKEKLFLLDRMGVDSVLVIPFDKRTAQMPAKDFIKEVIVSKIGVKCLVTGHNHTFGREGSGNSDLLNQLSRQLGFDVYIVDPVDYRGDHISSTRIRNLLSSGDVHTAEKLLGHLYFATGEVTEGRKFGRTLGFPTANVLSGAKEKLLPQNGVYAVYTETAAGAFNGMAYIGMNPTFNGYEKRLEVHLFDFNEDIYKTEVTVHFIKKFRNEKKFDSAEDLKKQIERDKKETLAFLSKISRRY